MIIDGKKIAEEIYNEIKDEVSKLNRKPSLAVILVGNDDSPSLRYVKNKQKTAKELGYNFRLKQFKTNISEKELVAEINLLNNDINVDGFMIQTPLPNHIDTSKILGLIKPSKDVDGFHPENQGKVVIGNNSGLQPCTPAGIMELLKRYKIEVQGKTVAMIGSSNIVGKPMANLLINKEATVTVCNSNTPDISKYTKNADIIITATGVTGLITKDIIGDSTIIIDVGFTVKNGKIYGDADFKNIEKKGNLITPVPGGVGPMTIAMLMKNTLKAYNNNLI